MWKFDVGIEQWTWVKGSNLRSQGGVYGQKGIPEGGNTPGARAYSSSWRDSNNNLWLFGGQGSGLFADLWMFNHENWTWVAGSSQTFQYGVYGTQGVSSSANFPGSRMSAFWSIDSHDNLWLFGGSGYSGVSGDSGLLSPKA